MDSLLIQSTSQWCVFECRCLELSICELPGPFLFLSLTHTHTGVVFTLPPPFVQPTSLRQAHLFDKPQWFEPMMNKTDVLGGNHANTHLALAVGGAQRYVQIADPGYKEATTFFYETLRDAHSYSTGGSNFREYWQAAHGQGTSILDVMKAKPDSFAGHDNEESCTTYNFLKIIRHLFEWSPSPALLEMYSYALTNGVMGIQRGTQPGVMLYLLPLGTGVTKGNSTRGWGTPFTDFWCCYGTGIESFSKLADSIFWMELKANSALIIARYVPSKLDAAATRGGWVVHVTTGAGGASLATSGKATITVDAPPAMGGEQTMKLLIPSWSASPTVEVNGVAVAAAANPGSFHSISRTWKRGDTIELTLPAVLTLSKVRA